MHLAFFHNTYKGGSSEYDYDHFAKQKLNVYRACRVEGVIWPDVVPSAIDKCTNAEKMYSIIYGETKKIAASAANRMISGERGAEAMCLFADNALWRLSRTQDSSSQKCLAQEAVQGFNTALSESFGYSHAGKSIDALLGLFSLTGEKHYLEQAKGIDAQAVYRATFGLGVRLNGISRIIHGCLFAVGGKPSVNPGRLRSS